MSGALLSAEADTKVEANRKLNEQIDLAKSKFGLRPEGRKCECNPETGKWKACCHVRS